MGLASENFNQEFACNFLSFKNPVFLKNNKKAFFLNLFDFFSKNKTLKNHPLVYLLSGSKETKGKAQGETMTKSTF